MPVRPNRIGFTIVEMLVVIGIIALLIGLVVPALGGARRRALKSEELNSLRQIAQAWTIYANNNNDATLPGYLEPEVQKRWKVAYEYHDGTRIPPAPTFTVGDPGNPNIAGPWVWRLLYYLDFTHDIVHGYRQEADTSVLSAVAEAEELSLTPGFGYNAYYMGGWWVAEDVSNEDPEGSYDQIARPRFYDATDPDNTALDRNVISRSIGAIRRSTEVITFGSAVLYQPGVYHFDRFRNDIDGFHYIVPPFLAERELWGQAVGAEGGGPPGGGATMTGRNRATPFTIEVFEGLLDDGRTPVPLGRFNGKTALTFADGHTDAQHPGSLTDMRMWIDAATKPRFVHTEGTLGP